jgi:hypothetical protein
VLFVEFILKQVSPDLIFRFWGFNTVLTFQLRYVIVKIIHFKLMAIKLNFEHIVTRYIT